MRERLLSSLRARSGKACARFQVVVLPSFARTSIQLIGQVSKQTIRHKRIRSHFLSGTMDPELRAIIVAGGRELARQNAERTAAARDAKRRKREADARDREVADAAAQRQRVHAAALALPGAASILGVRNQRFASTPLHLLGRLALSPKARGSGPSADRVRKMQNIATALMAKACLMRQADGFAMWCDDEGSTEDVRGVVCMWDEASQKMKGLLGQAWANKSKQAFRSQMVVEFMVALCSVVQGRALQDGGTAWAWQPYIAPPLAMPSTKHGVIMEALDMAMPVQLSDVDSLQHFAKNVGVALVVLTFDGASSNLKSVSRMLGVVESLPPSGDHVLLHGERCLTHMLHIVKSSVLASGGIAAHLFSISKIVRHSRSLDGLSATMLSNVRSKLQVRCGWPEDREQNDLFDILTAVLGIDGDHTMVYQQGPKKKLASLCRDIKDLCRKCFWDKASGKWLLYVGHSAGNQDLDLDAAVASIAEPLQKVLIGRRWENAALNRWSGTIRCLKRLVLGCVLNGILPDSLSGLSAAMDITAAKVESMLRAMQAKQLAGDDDHNEWVRHCSRVVRLSAFFAHRSRRWQMGVVLVVSSAIDRLHWRILGFNGVPKLALGGLVDPGVSEVGRLMDELWHLADKWAATEAWRVLPWLGLDRLDDASAMLFARRVVISLSCGVFVQAERRFSTWPYKLQHLISPHTTEGQKLEVMQQLLQARPCCLGPFGRRFRALFPDIGALQSPKCRRTLELFGRMVKFTTSPVENEHKRVGDAAASLTTGSTTAPLCHRTVCQHLLSAHLQMGNEDTSFPMGRRKDRQQNTGPTLACLPPPDTGKQAEPLEDARSTGAPRLGDLELGLGELGGGNPKVCFINYRLALLKRQRGSLTHEQVVQARALAVATYDGDEATKQRWSEIFSYVQARRRAKKDSVVVRADAQESGASPTRVWPDVFQVEGQPCAAPIADGVLSEVKSLAGPTLPHLEALAQDDRPFKVTGEKSAPPSASPSLWGCGGELRNVCKAMVSGSNCLPEFVGFKVAINEYVDRIGKEAARAVDKLLVFRTEGPGGCLCLWFLLGFAAFQPKCQVFVQCGLEGRPTPTEVAMEPKVPYMVELLVRPSRMCGEVPQEHAVFKSFNHVTSDELAFRLASSGQHWSLGEAAYTIDITAQSLRKMRVSGCSEATPLSTKKKSAKAAAQAEDAFQKLLRMPTCSAAAHGLAAALLPPYSSTPTGGTQGDEAAGDEAGRHGDVDEDLFADGIVDHMLGELGSLGAGGADFDFDLEVALGEVVDESDGVGMPDEGAESDGAADFDDARDAPHIVDEQGAAEVAGDVAPEVAVVEAAIEVQTVAEGGDPEVDAGTESNAEGRVFISPLGYVRVRGDPFDFNKPVGLVSVQSKGKVRFANCHLHPHCNLRVGIVNEDVPRMRLAEWLALGVPCYDLPKPQREELGKQHRALWRRKGPLPQPP